MASTWRDYYLVLQYICFPVPEKIRICIFFCGICLPEKQLGRLAFRIWTVERDLYKKEKNICKHVFGKNQMLYIRIMHGVFILENKLNVELKILYF